MQNSSESSKKVVLITGGSRGIGLAFCKEFLQKGYSVINFSRTKSEIQNPNFKQIFCDLAQTIEASNLFQKELACLNQTEKEELILINNAGVLDPMYLVGSKIDSEVILNHLAINTFIPMDFTARFLHTFTENSNFKLIINVGSGAVNRPIEGWSVYGASKSALHYYSQTVALEQKRARNPSLIVIFDPGRTDTEMQLKIRNAETDNFPAVESFKLAFDEGKLNNPSLLAQKVVEKVVAKTIQNGDYILHSNL